VQNLPDEGASVVLRDQHGGEYRSQVLAVTPSAIKLAPPSDLNNVGEGTRLLVTWPDRTALLVLPVVVNAVDTAEPAWHVRIADDPWREERRRHLRRTLNASLQVWYEAHGQEVSADGIVVDLSEAAVRCAVTNDHSELRVSATPVQLELHIDGDELKIDGYVLKGRPAARADLRLEVVILFERPVPDLEHLRKHLD